MGTSQLHIENSNLGSHTLLVYESQLRPFLLKIEHQKGEAKVFALQIKSHTLPAGPSIFLKFFGLTQLRCKHFNINIDIDTIFIELIYASAPQQFFPSDQTPIWKKKKKKKLEGLAANST